MALTYSASFLLGAASHRPEIEAVLPAFGQDAVTLLDHFGIRIVVLEVGQGFADVSPALRRLGATVDRWPIPPAGLFVVEERLVLMRVADAMTLGHELGHAMDCTLGGGTYLSGTDPALRRLFRAATRFVTPYAAAAPDEFFAEAVRAHVGLNAAGCPWPRATPERLRAQDRALATYMEELFSQRIPRLVVGLAGIA